MALYSDWVGINSSLDSTKENDKWTTWKKDDSSKHPAAREYTDFQKEEYEDLANTVMFHKCTTYCKKDAQAECKFKFPKKAQAETKLVYNKVSKNLGTDYFVTYETKRNEASSIINQHNICHLKLARANVDMKVMYDNKLCIIYVTKYCTKCEQKSDSMKRARSAIIQREVRN